MYGYIVLWITAPFFENNVRSSTNYDWYINFIMEIKVLGTGCSSCKALYETTKQAISELGCDATLIKEEDLLKIMEYNILSLPALVIDGKVISAGKRLSLSEVKELITK